MSDKGSYKRVRTVLSTGISCWAGAEESQEGAGVTAALIIKTTREVPGRKDRKEAWTSTEKSEKASQCVWEFLQLRRLWSRSGPAGQGFQDGEQKMEAENGEGLRMETRMPPSITSVSLSLLTLCLPPHTAGHTACCFKFQQAHRKVECIYESFPAPCHLDPKIVFQVQIVAKPYLYRSQLENDSCQMC